MPIEKRSCKECGIAKPVTLFNGEYCIDCLSVVRHKEEKIKTDRARRKREPNHSAKRAIEQSKLKQETEHKQQQAALPENVQKKKLAAQKLLAERELSRRHLLPFVQYFNPDYVPGWVHVDIATRLEQFAQDVKDGKSPRLMLFMPPRHGKQLADSTPMLTTEGWKTHGELTVGDYVFHPSGKPVQVLATSGKTPSDYLVELTNGDVIRCHENHEWTVFTTKQKQTVTTLELSPGFMLPNVIDPENKNRLLKASVKSVTYSPNGEQGHCIQVDSEDGLYLAGENLTPTHNSELASKTFPAWFLGHNPKSEVIATSYSAELALDFSRKVRGLIQDPEYQHIFPTKLDRSSQSAERWNTDAGGGYVAAGVGGPITGRGAHCLWSGCSVTTPYGTIPIEEVQVGDYVWGYNHETKQQQWTEVKAVSTQYKPELLKIREVWSTPDHRFFVKNRGYVQARHTLQRDLSDSSMPPVQQDVRQKAIGHKTDSEEPAFLFSEMRTGRSACRTQDHMQMREEKSSTCSNLRRLLSGTKTINTGETPVSLLQKRIYTAKSGARKIGTSAWRKFTSVLFDRMLPKNTCRRISNNSRTSWAFLRTVRQTAGAVAGKTRPTVLFSQLLPQMAQSARRIFRIPGVSWGLANTAQQPYGIGLAPMPNVPFSQRVGSSSYKPQSKLPRQEQSDYAVSKVPLAVSQQRGVCARELASSIHGSGYRVVDIQTGTENFFAEGVLVHNCAIIDDPVKNREEAESATNRQKIKDWYTSTLYTRLAPGGGVLVILTRWHDDDLAGWLLEQEKGGADQWDVVRYPAIAIEDEEHRKKGEPLHEERYPLEALERIKRAVGPRDWSALYQQDPVPDSGSYFKTPWFKYYAPSDRPPLEDLRVYQAWDFAIGQDETNDWTVGVTIGVDRDGNSYILNTVRGHWDSFEIVEQMLEQGRMWKPALVGGESGQIEMAIGPLLKKRMRETKTFFPIERLKTGKRDKQLRARPLQGRMQQGLVLLPEKTSWALTLQNEMLRFPAGTHDDQVDALAWCFQMLESFSYVVKPKEKPKKSWKDQLGKYTKSGGRGSHMTA